MPSENLKTMEKIKSRFKEWYSKEPKHSFYYYAFWGYFIYNMLIKRITYMVFFQIGLLSPEVDPTPVINRISQETVDNLFIPFMRLFEAGANVATNNPTLAYWLSNILGYLPVYGLLIIIGYFIHGVLRNAIHDYMKKRNFRGNNF